MNKKIAFIGVGNMASAIINGIVSRENNPVLWSDIILFNRHIEKIEKYRDYGAYIAETLEEAVECSDYVFLCVKPQSFSDVLPLLSRIEKIENKVFVSIAAGITSDTVSAAANNAAVIRVMPNTPMLIGKGVSALSRNEYVSDDDFKFVCDVFSSAGDIVVIREDEMNRIICVTGSSPAYVFMMIKAMLDGAAKQGLLRTDDDCGLTSKELTDCICNTIIGAAELMKSGTKSPEEQIATVASKGGTTERAISELNEYKFCEAIVSAMDKCTRRANELGKK